MTEFFFGYGSLLNKNSLLETAPHAQGIRPAFIRGYIREFGVWDPGALLASTSDDSYALNIKKVDNAEKRVNGIIFSVNEGEIANLLSREDGYLEIMEPVFDYQSGEKLGLADLFEKIQDANRFLFGSSSQEEYLKLCLDGARSFGEAFYQEFINTTLIVGCPLSKIPELRKFLSSTVS